MADEKKILVVDDHFEMLELLRSMLELSNQDFEVLAVPSAEEGLLELRRMRFDLVITDVRLPGMSGFDLVRRTRAIKSDTPIIMITAYSTAQGRKEAEELGVLRYFPKPLDTDEMLSAVHKALYGESVTLIKTVPVSEKPTAAIPNQVQKRLESLRTDTGAAQLILATTAGQTALSVGNGRIPNPQKLITLLSQNLEDSFLLAEELGQKKPFTLQYHVGATIELYVANVGRHYFLAMFFDMQARRGRIGTVWVFAQRAIKELLNLLPQDGPVNAAPVIEPADLGQSAEKMAAEVETAKKVETAVPPPPPITPKETQPEPEEEWLDIDPEDLARLLTTEAELPNDTARLDAFWDEALTDIEEANTAAGFSWEEAKKQGLVPSDLDFDDET